MTEEIFYLELAELTRRMHAKELSPVEVTRSLLDRIDLLDRRLQSFALVLPEMALRQAHQAEEEIGRGEIRGPLHGAPLGIKDLCWVQGIPATGGMPMYANFRPDKDATIVRRLSEAGGVTLGITRMTENAFADHHPSVPVPRNPWGEDRWTGVSSSGSGVATAAGLCYGAIGSDTGGSIRFPSAANGLTGLKPTWGLVSRFGAYELAATLDHLGPMTRSALDCAIMLQVMAGTDLNDPTTSLREVPNYREHIGSGIRGLLVGVDEAWNNRGTDAATTAMMEKVISVIRALGGAVLPVRFPDESDMIRNWMPLCGVEAAVVHENTYPQRREEYGPSVAKLLDLGRNVSGMDYQKMLLQRLSFRGRVAALFEEVDLLLAPTQPLASPTNARMLDLGTDADFNANMLRFTAPFNMSGHPTITLPGGATLEGLPIGFQFIAGAFRESVLFRAGYAFQQATEWHKRHPKGLPHEHSAAEAPRTTLH
jgi:amidase